MGMYKSVFLVIAVPLILGLAACQSLAVDGNSTEPTGQAPDLTATPTPEGQQAVPLILITPSGIPTEISNIRPADGSQVCQRPEIGLDIRLNDAMRRNGQFDLATVKLTIDGNDVTKNANVAAAQSFPQISASLTYVPPAPLPLGSHQATFAFPATTGSQNVAWTFVTANIPCTSPGSAANATPNPAEKPLSPGQPLPGGTRPANMPAEILSIYPPSGSQVCPRPQIGLAIRLNDAMRRDGQLDLTKVTLALDGSNVTQKASVSGSLTFPQDQASLVYIPPSALSGGAHTVAFTFPGASGKKSFNWNFNVAQIPCQ